MEKEDKDNGWRKKRKYTHLRSSVMESFLAGIKPSILRIMPLLDQVSLFRSKANSHDQCSYVGRIIHQDAAVSQSSCDLITNNVVIPRGRDEPTRMSDMGTV